MTLTFGKSSCSKSRGQKTDFSPRSWSGGASSGLIVVEDDGEAFRLINLETGNFERGFLLELLEDVEVCVSGPGAAARLQVQVCSGWPCSPCTKTTLPWVSDLSFQGLKQCILDHSVLPST